VNFASFLAARPFAEARCFLGSFPWTKIKPGYWKDFVATGRFFTETPSNKRDTNTTEMNKLTWWQKWVGWPACIAAIIAGARIILEAHGNREIIGGGFVVIAFAILGMIILYKIPRITAEERAKDQRDRLNLIDK
jgi:hypothetical protein